MSKIILGIDPGTNVMGFGILKTEGKSMTMIDFGVCHFKHEDPLQKLKMVFEEVDKLIKHYKPHVAAIEAPFQGKNIQSMLKLGRAQGVAIATLLLSEVPVFEYSPRSIKQSITGKGAASKEQVAAMLQRLLNIEEIPKFLDATDGLAAAVCHFFKGTSEVPVSNKKGKGWEAFLKNNPERLAK